MAAIFMILYAIVWCALFRVCGWSGFLWRRRRQYRRPIEHIQYILLLSYNALANDNTMIGIIACKSGYTLIFPVNRVRKIRWINIDILIDNYRWLIDLNMLYM